MKYYSVDRRGVYAEGKRIMLEPNPDPGGNDIHAHINRMYPDGFSLHGAAHYRNVPPPARTAEEAQRAYTSALLDYMLEACRKGHFPEKPSRYQSMFACESIEDAVRFRASHGKESDPIFELAPEAVVHRGDMALYTMAPTMAGLDHRLHLYWQGETLEISGHPTQWEHVLALPVSVGRRVV